MWWLIGHRMSLNALFVSAKGFFCTYRRASNVLPCHECVFAQGKSAGGDLRTFCFDFTHCTIILSSTRWPFFVVKMNRYVVIRGNKCAYCMAAHTAGGKRAELADEVIESLRAGSSLNDSKLSALANFARKMLNKRGWVDKEDIDDFLGAGYTKSNVFDVITALAAKTLSNYTNHIIDTPVDDSISKFKWDKT